MRCGLVALATLWMGIGVAAAWGGGDPASDQRFDYFDRLRVSSAVPSPEQGLGHAIGERFTRHAQMVSYLESLASTSDRVRIREYGRTPQGRALLILTISSPSNLSRLDSILEANRALADPETLEDAMRARIIESNPAVAWLSYNVHGNEASASEAAIQVAYTLASSTNDEVREILDELVIVIDPMLNPDGRERYVSWFQNTRGMSPEPHPDASEHHEPWPGGRPNHYLFDLNRDWVWLVQPESRQRLAVYREYLPQLHIDYHEQEYTRPYFFGSGDDPYNTNLPPSLREWTDRYGEANAAVFDQRGLLYSTKERFDYLYPGYGKVLPCYHGAVGMLCEQAGHSRAGLAIEVTDTYTLTLGERARNHFLTSMSYLETTAAVRSEQLERFAGYFRESAAGGFDGDETEWGFIISGDSPARAMEHLARMCDLHGIRVERTVSAQRVPGLEDYWSGRRVTAELPAGSWVIRTAQPMGRLVKALFERDPRVEDIETYDITAWSLPMCFGLDAWYTYESPSVETEPLDLAALETMTAPVTGEGGVALIVSSAQDRFYGAMEVVASESLEARLAGETFQLEGRVFPSGSLIVHLVRNGHVDESTLVERFVEAGLSVHRAAVGMTESGPVLGANANRRASVPTILLLRGSALSSLSFGQHWHLLDAAAPMSHTVAGLDRLRSMDLDRYTTIVLPDGSDLERAMRTEGVERLKRWMRSGGVLVAVGRSAVWANRELAGAASDSDASSDDDESPSASMTYEERRRRNVERRVSGALFRGVVDLTHPLSAGLGEDVAFLKRSTRQLPVSTSGEVVVRYHETAPHVAGVVPRRAAKRFAGKPAVTYHSVGSGGVIAFCDDPTIRGFMHGPVRVLLNAILYGASL